MRNLESAQSVQVGKLVAQILQKFMTVSDSMTGGHRIGAHSLKELRESMLAL
jgi:hypothetical protein